MDVAQQVVEGLLTPLPGNVRNITCESLLPVTENLSLGQEMKIFLAPTL